MDVRIGVTYTAKEIDVALGGDVSVFWITDRKGRRVGIPTDKIAYVEIGTPDAARRIGFGG